MSVQRAHIILYVPDQRAASAFYQAVLQVAPLLQVPGMTELPLAGEAVLGLMPEAGIHRLLGGAVDPAASPGASRAELYLVVEDPAAAHQRALAAGATELSPLAPRDWGDDVAYSRAPDGTVLAFARPSVVEEADLDFTLEEPRPGRCVAVLRGEGARLDSAAAALDRIVEARARGAAAMVVPAARLSPDFFDLSTRLAGEILQRFTNYRCPVAIVGDFSRVAPGPLADFIRESNRGQQTFFLGSVAEALDRLDRLLG